MYQVETVLNVQNKLGEGPLWHPEEHTLYWVDIEGHRFHRLNPATGQHEVFEVGLPLGTLAFREKGGLILATKNGFAFWDEDKQTPEFFDDPEADKPDARFNDGAVDRQGRFWAGTMGDGSNNNLYRLNPDGSLHIMETGLTISNGIGWSPDNKTMYFTDSMPRMIYAYDFDAVTGAIENRRPFIHTPDEPGVPDGLTVDREGFIWSARWDGWKITRYDPDGKPEREIDIPAQCPTSCTFGGPDYNELYVTSASTGIDWMERVKQPEAGNLFRIHVDVKGFPEPKFAG